MQTRAPVIWDDVALADWATPIAALQIRPGHYKPADYYAVPAENLRTYPVYLPDKEPPGYWESLKKKKPEPLVDVSTIRTKGDWTEAGARARNRWYTNGGAGDVVYADRAEADRKLLTYTSAGLPTDVEITGHPLVTIHVASTHPDGAFIVYLEDVAPDGDVTYLTEGQLRAVMRRITNDRPPYWEPGPHRSELRADAAPLVPGDVAEITFRLWATSVLIRQGHRITVAIAGADADTFLRYPRDGGVPVLSVQRSAARQSRVEVPMRPRP